MKGKKQEVHNSAVNISKIRTLTNSMTRAVRRIVLRTMKCQYRLVFGTGRSWHINREFYPGAMKYQGKSVFTIEIVCLGRLSVDSEILVWLVLVWKVIY